MPVTGVVNLRDGLLGQATPEAEGLPARAILSTVSAPSALPHDEFTPSSLSDSVNSTAQAAGLFSAPRVSALPASLTSATSLFEPLATNPSADTVQTNSLDAAQNGDANTPDGSTSTNGGAQGAPNAKNASRASTFTAPGSVAQQTQLNTLNNALAAFGLSAADIQKIDQVASRLNEFDPTAFTSLVYQLKVQAQNSPAQNAQARPTDASSNAPTATKVKSTAA